MEHYDLFPIHIHCKYKTGLSPSFELPLYLTFSMSRGSESFLIHFILTYFGWHRINALKITHLLYITSVICLIFVSGLESSSIFWIWGSEVRHTIGLPANTYIHDMGVCWYIFVSHLTQSCFINCDFGSIVFRMCDA